MPDPSTEMYAKNDSGAHVKAPSEVLDHFNSPSTSPFHEERNLSWYFLSGLNCQALVDLVF